jgi:hypothetical protein
MEKCTWASGKQNINIVVKEFVIKVGAAPAHSLAGGSVLLLCTIVYSQCFAAVSFGAFLILFELLLGTILKIRIALSLEHLFFSRHGYLCCFIKDTF